MSEQKTFALGIDLGGTKILAAVINVSTGEVVASARKRTHAERGQDFVSQRTIELASAALQAAKLTTSDIVAIGVGAAGQVNRQAGVITNAPNLGLQNLALGSLMQTHFSVPVYIGNDVEVAAMGEALYGSGVGYHNFICIFVGTGIGSGIVLNGQMYTGLTGTAGEVGHMTVQADGRICGCGSRGCLEAYASRSAITKAILAEIHHGRSSILSPQEPGLVKEGDRIIRSGVLADAIKHKDELVIEVMTEAANFLGYGLSSIMNFYNPESIILGGGVIEAIDLLFDIAVRRARTTALAATSKKTPIVRTKLGDFSGVVGAACLGAQSAGHKLSPTKP